MHIAILGKGAVGKALGAGFAAAGHSVVYGVRKPGGADEASVADAAAAAETVVIATPWDAVPDAIAAAGGLAGKTVIDCTNPLVFADGRLQLAIGHTTSGGEEVARMAPEAFVFKTLNQTGAENLGAAGRFAKRPAMFVAGDDAARKPAVLDLVSDLGFEALDAGPLYNARLLEAYAMLWIDQVLGRGQSRDFAFVRAFAGA